MNDDREHSQQQMLTMHKRKITMPDGKRQMIFYTFSDPEHTQKQNLSPSGRGTSAAGGPGEGSHV